MRNVVRICDVIGELIKSEKQMKRKRLLKYFICMLIVVFVLLFINIFIRLLIFFRNDEGRMPSRANAVKEELCIADNGEISLTDSAVSKLKSNNEFAMVISDDGKVIWSIDRPTELPEQYTISDVAAFSHWYLKGYPVYTAVLNEGILVVGEPKNSVWRYNLVFEMDDLKESMKVFPIVMIADILIAIIIPFLIMRLQEKSNEKERIQWISGVSHDIRTPLSLILCNAQDIIDNEEKTEPDNIYTKTKLIKSQTLRIRELITNLNTENVLSFGIKKSGEELNLISLIRDTVCSVMEQDEDGIYDVEFDMCGELENTMVKADEGLIKRLITNLLINSITHNPDGCRIKISLKPANANNREYVMQQCGKIPIISHFKKRTSIILTIQDNGVGANPETINRLNSKAAANDLSGYNKYANTCKFAMRKRLRVKSLTGLSNSCGVGHNLGLIVVKKIASLYRWKISFASYNGFSSEIIIK